MTGTVISGELRAALEDWLNNKDLGEGTRERADKVIELVGKEKEATNS